VEVPVIVFDDLQLVLLMGWWYSGRVRLSNAPGNRVGMHSTDGLLHDRPLSMTGVEESYVG
jgi:hypothetical protein